VAATIFLTAPQFWLSWSDSVTVCMNIVYHKWSFWEPQFPLGLGYHLWTNLEMNTRHTGRDGDQLLGLTQSCVYLLQDIVANFPCLTLTVTLYSVHHQLCN